MRATHTHTHTHRHQRCSSFSYRQAAADGRPPRLALSVFSIDFPPATTLRVALLTARTGPQLVCVRARAELGSGRLANGRSPIPSQSHTQYSQLACLGLVQPSASTGRLELCSSACAWALAVGAEFVRRAVWVVVIYRRAEQGLRPRPRLAWCVLSAGNREWKIAQKIVGCLAE